IIRTICRQVFPCNIISACHTNLADINLVGQLLDNSRNIFALTFHFLNENGFALLLVTSLSLTSSTNSGQFVAITQVVVNGGQISVNDIVNISPGRTSVLDSLLQNSFQVRICLKLNILGSILVQSSDDFAGQAGINNGVLLAVIRLSAVGAASQHGDSHDAGQSQRSNLLEFHSEFFLLMVYKR